MSLGSLPSPSSMVLSSSATFVHPLLIEKEAHKTRPDPPNRLRAALNLG
jgi:hypothetical protein